MRIVYRSPFIPAEWIAAHGHSPCRLVPSGHQRQHFAEPQAEGLCPFVRGFLDESLSPSEECAVVLTTFCDQVRRAGEYAANSAAHPVHVMHLPATWQSIAAQRLYRSELLRLGRFLVSRGGASPDNEHVAETVRAYDRKRQQLSSLLPGATNSAAAAALARFLQDGELPSEPIAQTRHTGAVPLALLGGPLCAKDRVLYDMLEDMGAYVAVDGAETGERTLPRRPRERALLGDALGELCDMYFAHIPDAFRRPNTLLYRWIRQILPERGARGVVLVRYIWCDTWHAEVKRMRDWLTVPLVDVDLTDKPPMARTRTRLQAFIESLR